MLCHHNMISNRGTQSRIVINMPIKFFLITALIILIIVNCSGANTPLHHFIRLNFCVHEYNSKTPPLRCSLLIFYVMLLMVIISPLKCFALIFITSETRRKLMSIGDHTFRKLYKTGLVSSRGILLEQ